MPNRSDQLVLENLARADQKTVRLVRKTAERLLGLEKAHNYYLEIYLVDDSFMQKNVLSFVAPADFPRPDLKDKIPLGEIYLNPSYIAAEPLEIRDLKLEISTWSLDEIKLAYMLIHGFLHLRGYDHEKKNDRIVMEQKEVQLLSAMPKL